jgi:hypothetical protein
MLAVQPDSEQIKELGCSHNQQQSVLLLLLLLLPAHTEIQPCLLFPCWPVCCDSHLAAAAAAARPPRGVIKVLRRLELFSPARLPLMLQGTHSRYM